MFHADADNGGPISGRVDREVLPPQAMHYLASLTDTQSTGYCGILYALFINHSGKVNLNFFSIYCDIMNNNCVTIYRLSNKVKRKIGRTCTVGYR